MLECLVLGSALDLAPPQVTWQVPDGVPPSSDVRPMGRTSILRNRSLVAEGCRGLITNATGAT